MSIPLLLAALLAAGDTVRVPLTPADTVAVEVSGSAGTPVVIVPGLLGGAYSFRKVVDGLTGEGFRVYVIDLFNPRNLADAPDASLFAQSERLAAVLDSLDVRGAIVIAHALGGGVAYRAALARPDLARTIVALEAGPAETANSPGVRGALKYQLLIRIIGVRRALEKQIGGGIRKSAADPSWVTADLVRAYATPFADDFGLTTRVFKAMSESKEPWLLGPRLPELRTPVHFLSAGGPREGAMPPEEMEQLKMLPNLEMHTVENAGTWIQEERPDYIIDLVRKLQTR